MLRYTRKTLIREIVVVLAALVMLYGAAFILSKPSQLPEQPN